jgi:hypothetical protein
MSVIIMKQIQKRENPNDKIYTPPQIVDIMLELCEYKKGININVLDPCKGGGAFYNKLDYPKSFCEIDQNIDFFDNNEFYDLIVGNPPYSILDNWLKHTYTKCNKFCYIIGMYSLTPKRIKNMEESGFYIEKMTLTQVPTWFSRSYIIVCKKGIKKNNNIIFDYKFLGNKCLYCNKPCGGANKDHCKRRSADKECRY